MFPSSLQLSRREVRREVLLPWSSTAAWETRRVPAASSSGRRVKAGKVGASGRAEVQVWALQDATHAAGQLDFVKHDLFPHWILNSFVG